MHWLGIYSCQKIDDLWQPFCFITTVWDILDECICSIQHISKDWLKDFLSFFACYHSNRLLLHLRSKYGNICFSLLCLDDLNHPWIFTGAFADIGTSCRSRRHLSLSGIFGLEDPFRRIFQLFPVKQQMWICLPLQFHVEPLPRLYFLHSCFCLK